MTDHRPDPGLLLALLDGTRFANALRRNGKPCRIRLPDDPARRAALVRAHLRGDQSILTFCAEGRDPWREPVHAVVLAAFCPAADGRCRWIGIDVDAADHGESGLADAVHGTRAIAERAAYAGLMSGLLVARSRRGRGRHVFLIFSEPVELSEAAIGVAALVSATFKVAASDVTEYGAKHAFNCANGAIARPGDAGAVELFPRSTVQPPYGWALVLPAAGALRVLGGGVIVDPFTDQPMHHERVPRCDAREWRRLVAENRHALDRMPQRQPPRHPRYVESLRSQRLHPLTEQFLAGHTPKGGRNEAAFSAACNLLRHGLPLPEVEYEILRGACGCELPEREARSAIRSAVRTVERSQ